MSNTADGFILDDNKWDSLRLDTFVLPAVTGIAGSRIRQRLESAGFLGSVKKPGGLVQPLICLK